MIPGKKWTFMSIGILLTGLIMAGTLTAVVDPFFHYHAPLPQFQYPIANERYQNDGIIKHFNYDAIITGTSMTENFKASELDGLFNVKSIKVPFSGARYKEINENLKRAFQANPDIKLVVRGLDYKLLLKDKDDERYETYPTYLYDNCLWNDVYYIFNKEVLIKNTLSVIEYTRSGGKTTDFDQYANWMDKVEFGKKAVDKDYSRQALTDGKPAPFTKEDKQMVEDSIRQNIVELVMEYPDTKFYLFFTPYSIYYWDSLKQSGNLERQLEAEKAAIEILLECDNVNLFSFFDEFDMICNLDNYKDIAHYSQDINSMILRAMHEGKNQLTWENYLFYCEKTKNFYTSYDYESMFIK